VHDLVPDCSVRASLFAFIVFCLLRFRSPSFCFVFFFNDTATPEIYTLSLHDALPICRSVLCAYRQTMPISHVCTLDLSSKLHARSEEHTSELQSPYDLVCRLLLEKKKNTI